MFNCRILAVVMFVFSFCALCAELQPYYSYKEKRATFVAVPRAAGEITFKNPLEAGKVYKEGDLIEVEWDSTVSVTDYERTVVLLGNFKYVNLSGGQVDLVFLYPFKDVIWDPSVKKVSIPLTDEIIKQVVVAFNGGAEYDYPVLPAPEIKQNLFFQVQHEIWSVAANRWVSVNSARTNRVEFEETIPTNLTVSPIQAMTIVEEVAVTLPISIVTNASVHTAYVDWGDGVITVNSYTHAYSSHGTYKVKVTVVADELEAVIYADVTVLPRAEHRSGVWVGNTYYLEQGVVGKALYYRVNRLGEREIREVNPGAKKKSSLRGWSQATLKP